MFLCINDKGGADSIIATDVNFTGNLFAFFNVSLDKKGNITNETTIHLLNSADNSGILVQQRKKVSTDKITIKNALVKDGNVGKGYIESSDLHQNQ